MARNGTPVTPIEIHLNSCSVQVFESNEDTSKQMRIHHVTGVPVVFVLTLTEEAAKQIAGQLQGSRLHIASQLPE